jgi:glycosyltransferase involved in cell wall biosynthesis
MKIALVISALGAGGAERVIVTVANEWVARGRTVTLLTFEPPGTRPYYALDPRVTLRQLNVVGTGRRRLGIRQTVNRILALRRALRAVQPDVVVSFLAKINIVTLLATRGLGLGVVISDHNNHERQAASPVWRVLRERLYGWADRLVAPSQGVLATMPTATAGRGHVIPNSVDLPPFSARRGIGRILVAVGRLDEQKGFDLLLPAFARVAGGHPDWRLVIWGEGTDRPQLEALRDRLGLADRVGLPGLTGRPGQWVEDATLFVLSSRFEGFGIVITEAMAAGVPVIVTDCPWGPSEIVTHGVDGWLVPPEDVAALAEGLDLLMGDEALRTRLAEVARQSVKRFDRESVMALWDDLVDGVRPGKRAPARTGAKRLRSEAR